jgi:hypothetical protein
MTARLDEAMAEIWQSARKDLISRFGRRFQKNSEYGAGGR